MEEKRLSVVLVEDNDDARETMKVLLELDGHAVDTAWNGHTGLLLIRERQPDLALVDLMLPGADGYAIARTLRAEGCRSLLVAVSGYGRPEDKRRAIEAGFDGHLTKPVSPEDLATVIGRARR
jgi:CheY-like chemotaxis protein